MEIEIHFSNDSCLAAFLQNGTNILSLIEQYLSTHVHDKESKQSVVEEYKESQMMGFVFTCVIFTLFTCIILLLMLKGSTEEKSQEFQVGKFMGKLSVVKRNFNDANERTQLIKAKRTAEWYSMKINEAKSNKLKNLSRTISNETKRLLHNRGNYNSIPDIVVSEANESTASSPLPWRQRKLWNEDYFFAGSFDSLETPGQWSDTRSESSFSSACYENEVEDSF